MARYADWWNIPNVDSETYARKLQVLRSHCDHVGRDYSGITKTYAGFIAIAPTDADAEALVAASPFIDPKTVPGVLVGSPSEIHRQLAELVELGAQHFILPFLDFPETKGAHLFAKEVASSFKA